MAVSNIEDFMDKKEQKLLLDFLEELSRLGPVELVGAATILHVDIYAIDKDDKKTLAETEVRPTEDILVDILETFDGYSMKQKENFVKLLKGRMK